MSCLALFESKQHMPPIMSFMKDRKPPGSHLWTNAEDVLLKSLIDRYSCNWPLVSECLNSSQTFKSAPRVDKRSPRDCFERWKEKWAPPEIRQKINEATASTPVGEGTPPPATNGSSQMTTRGVKRLASVSVSSPSNGAAMGSEPRKRRHHMLIQESIRKAQKKRAEFLQKHNGDPNVVQFSLLILNFF